MSSPRSDHYRRIIALLVEARKAAGITQVEPSARLDQRQTFISKVELSERRLDFAEFLVFCRAIGVDPYKLLRRAGISKKVEFKK